MWRSIDFSTTSQPTFDSQDIGAIAVAPSDPKTICVGTGVYKSTDAGRSWTHVGLADSRQIGALIVDPHDPNVVLVAAIGHAFGPKGWSRCTTPSRSSSACWCALSAARLDRTTPTCRP